MATMKLPTYSEDTEHWLTLVDAILVNNPTELSDQEKYGALLTVLPTSKVKDIAGLLANPPRAGKYPALQKALKKHLPQRSDEESFAELLTMSMGDIKPSVLLEDMMRINAQRTSKLPVDVVRSLHLQKMPLNLQALMETAGFEKDNEAYAQAADRILHRHANGPSLSHLYSVTDPRPSSAAGIVNTVQEAKRISQLEAEVKELRQQLQLHQPRQRKEWSQETDICYYHARFGTSARNCSQPCNFQGNFQAGRRQN